MANRTSRHLDFFSWSSAHSSCCMYFCRYWLLYGSNDMYSRRFPSGNLAKM